MSVVVLHSTESNPGTCDAVARYLIRMGYEPHEVFDPSNGDGAVLLAKSEPGKALMNLPGGVETNRRGGVYQIEIVGRAVDVPNYDDAWYERLRKRLVEVCEFTGTPYVFPLPFQPYPQSYGKNLVRMTFDEWLTFEGICGHQHVPENDHGDPGALDVQRLREDDDMPTPAEIWNHEVTYDGTTAPMWLWLMWTKDEVTRPDLLTKRVSDAVAEHGGVVTGGATPGQIADELGRRITGA